MNNTHNALRGLIDQQDSLVNRMKISKIERFIYRFPILSGMLAILLVIVGIIVGQKVGIAIPIPFFLLLSTVMLIATVVGQRAGLASALVASIFVVYAMITSFEPSSLTGSSFQTFLGILLFLIMALVLGKWSDQNHLVIRYLQQINHNLQQQLQKKELELSQSNMTIANIMAQHQRAERAQRETEKQFHSLTDMMIEAIFIYQDENLLYVNPAAIAITNYPNQEELLTTNFWDIIHPDFQCLRSKSHSPPLSENQITPRTEIKILTQSGQVKWLEFTTCPIEYQGETAMLGLALDITARKQTEETLCRLVQGISTDPEENFFQSLVKYLANLLQVDFAFIARLKEGSPKQLETLSVFAHQQHVDNFEYSLSNTPCEIVVNNQRFHAYSNRIQKQFPLDILLVEMGVESYFGVALCDANNQVIGILSVMDSKPIVNSSLIESVLQIISIRAAVELEQLLHIPLE